MPRYFKNIQALDEKKKEDLKKIWEEARNEKNKAEDELQAPVGETAAKPPSEKSKSRVILGAIFAVLVIVAGFFVAWYLYFSKASLAVLVKDQKSGQVLSDVLVSIAEQQVRTDQEGKARFENLAPGEQTLKISYEGYKESSQLVNLSRGDNGETEVVLDLDRIKVAGVILDYIDKKPVEEAMVTIGESTASSDTNGLFSLAEVLPGKQSLQIIKDSYNQFSLNYSSAQKGEENLGALKLIPQGRVVFGSNRDGYQAVYAASFDGGNVSKLWENVSGFDDTSPLLSPNQKKIAFFSTRDNQRDSYGNLKSLPYSYDVESREVQKITDDTDLSGVSWTVGGKTLVFLSYDHTAESAQNSYAVKAYDSSNDTLKTLAANSNFETKEATGSASISRLLVSPAEEKVAFTVNNYRSSDQEGIYMVDIAGLKPVKLTEKQPYSEFQFSSDGKTLLFDYYQSNGVKRYSVKVDTGTEVNIPFEEKRKAYYSQYGYYESKEVTSPDRAKKAFLDYRDGKNDVYISNPDGTGEKRLSYTGGVDKIAFAGAGRYLVFSVSLQTETALYVIGTDGEGNPIKITDIYPNSFAGVLNV